MDDPRIKNVSSRPTEGERAASQPADAQAGARVDALHAANDLLRREIADRRATEKRLEHVNAVLRAIRYVNQLVTRATRARDRDMLLQGVCDCLAETRGYHGAWCALFDVNHSLVAVASSGFNGAFATMEDQLQRGDIPPCWRVVLPTREVRALHPPNDPCHQCQLAPHYGTSGALLARLEHDGRVFGMLGVQCPPELINEEEFDLFAEVADEVSLALNTLELEVEQDRSSEALRKSEQHAHTIVETFPGLIWIWSPNRDQAPIYVSDQARTVCGVPAADLISGRVHLADLVHPDDIDRICERIAAALAAHRPYTLEYRLCRPDKQTAWVLEVGQGVFDEHGTLLHRIGSVLDVTDRIQAQADKLSLQAQLRQAQKMEAVGQLAGGVAHDFNNLLTAILGNAELARDRAVRLGVQDDFLNQSLEFIEHAGRRAATLTRQLLAFSRRQVIKPQVLDLNRALGTLEPMLRRLIGEHIHLYVNLAPALSPVFADPGQLEQVVLNLVVNARDAMPDGGDLQLETAAAAEPPPGITPDPATSAQYVTLTVRDSGRGMTPDVLQRVFEPFFTTKPAGRGTGLGLSTVYGIIQQAKGDITVESQPGQGTAFCVYLPTVDLPVSIEDEPHTGTPTGNETILLCEDEDSIRSLAARMLRRGGYTVLAAESGARAVHLAREQSNHIHLLLTDVVLTDTNGRKLADELVATRPDLRVLYMSGYTADVIAHHGVLDEGVEFLDKPFTLHGLLCRVREVLDHGASART